MIDTGTTMIIVKEGDAACDRNIHVVIAANAASTDIYDGKTIYGCL